MEKKTFLELQTEENKPLFEYISELENEIEVVEEVNKELTEKVEELSAAKTIGEAGEKAQAESKPLTIPTETFAVDNVNYKFIAPVFVWKGNRVEAAKALTDADLLNDLVAKGSGVITKA